MAEDAPSGFLDYARNDRFAILEPDILMQEELSSATRSLWAFSSDAARPTGRAQPAFPNPGSADPSAGDRTPGKHAGRRAIRRAGCRRLPASALRLLCRLTRYRRMLRASATHTDASLARCG